jgi:hypothetical protein
VKRSLQSIFEGSYSFDIEALKKQNLGKAEKDLEKLSGTTPFVRAYVTQNALGGHSVPVSAGALDVLYAVGAVSDAEADKGLAPGLERAIPKNKGVEFGSLLQQVGADLAASPGSSKLKGVLAEIDSEFKERLSARQARLEAAAAAQAVAAKDARDKARAEAKAAAAAAAEAKSAKSPPKTAARPAEPPRPAAEAPKPKDKETPRQKSPAPPAKKKDDAADKAARRSVAKGLARKKPR